MVLWRADASLTRQARGRSLVLLPEAAAVISASPVLVDDCGRKIFNVDPRSLGGSWRIEKALARLPDHLAIQWIAPQIAL
jgi:hypothetical protein